MFINSPLNSSKAISDRCSRADFILFSTDFHGRYATFSFLDGDSFQMPYALVVRNSAWNNEYPRDVFHFSKCLPVCWSSLHPQIREEVLPILDCKLPRLINFVEKISRSTRTFDDCIILLMQLVKTNLWKLSVGFLEGENPWLKYWYTSGKFDSKFFKSNQWTVSQRA